MNPEQIKIIRGFLEDFNQPNIKRILYQQFKNLYAITYDIYNSKSKTTIQGELECNWWKNRYYEREPYDDNRVILEDTKNNYINASPIANLAGNYSYIAAQGPLKETIHDFIQMLKQSNIRIIITACNEYENGMDKCFRYWTNSSNNEGYKPLRDFSVKLACEPVKHNGYVVRELQIKSESNQSDMYNVTQFHLTDWPDHGVPENIEPILNMLESMHYRMSENQKLYMGGQKLLVHCSAGCGRTGTIIAIDQIWNMMIENKLTPDCMYSVACANRYQRVNMIETFVSLRNL